MMVIIVLFCIKLTNLQSHSVQFVLLCISSRVLC